MTTDGHQVLTETSQSAPRLSPFAVYVMACILLVLDKLIAFEKELH